MGLVPIVEPEILIDGPHTAAVFAQASERVIGACIAALWRKGVALEACLLKPQMIVQVSNATCSDPISTGMYQPFRKGVWIVGLFVDGQFEHLKACVNSLLPSHSTSSGGRGGNMHRQSPPSLKSCSRASSTKPTGHRVHGPQGGPRRGGSADATRHAPRGTPSLGR